MFAEINPDYSTGFDCETLWENSGYDSPYLTSSGDNGAGPLYLTGTDRAAHMFVRTLTVPRTAAPGCQIGGANADLVTSGTTWDGPAMVVSGYGTSSEHFWLMWAGTNSAHNINIAEYDSNWNFIAEHTESQHATLTDLAGAWSTGYGYVWMSYCGTNNLVYYQFFNNVNGGTELHVSGASCDVDLYQGLYSGGVGISRDSTGGMVLTWGDKASSQVMMATL
jgi:hypothetical protein